MGRKVQIYLAFTRNQTQLLRFTSYVCVFVENLIECAFFYKKKFTIAMQHRFQITNSDDDAQTDDLSETDSQTTIYSQKLLDSDSQVSNFGSSKRYQ